MNKKICVWLEIAEKNFGNYYILWEVMIEFDRIENSEFNVRLISACNDVKIVHLKESFGIYLLIFLIWKADETYVEEF